jgi:CRP-like cAMP-binding protein
VPEAEGVRRVGVLPYLLLSGDVTSPESAEPDPWHRPMSIRVPAPMGSRGLEPRNRLLATVLSGRDFLSFRSHLETIHLARGSVLFDTGEPLTRVYFIETGVVALLTTLENRAIGVATVGREGAVDVHTLLLGGETSLGRCQVLVPGMALVVEVSWLRNALGRSPKLRAACQAYTRALLVQILQAVPCNRLHTVEQRCARWLLMCADQTEGDTFEVAKQGLAQMLGVAQPTLTIVARKLQSEGLISFRRSAITVVDRRRLETAACECYRLVRNRYRRVLARACG